MEENVAGEVAVDELRRRVDRLERGEQAVDPVVPSFAPGNAVTDLPRVRALVDDRVRPRHACEGCMEPVTDGDDVAPAAPVVAPVEVRRRDPAVDNVR